MVLTYRELSSRSTEALASLLPLTTPYPLFFDCRICTTVLLFCFSASALLQTYRGVGFPTVTDDSVPLVFRLSYMYYSLVGNLLVILVGLPVSYLTERPEPRCLDPKLFAPFIRKYLPQKYAPGKPINGDYILVSTKIEKASEMAGS